MVGTSSKLKRREGRWENGGKKRRRKEDERGANNNNNVTKPQNPTLQSAKASVTDF